MSNDWSGLPGICTAARHRVSVLAGAPGPVQAANAPAGTARLAAQTSTYGERRLASIAISPLWRTLGVVRDAPREIAGRPGTAAREKSSADAKAATRQLAPRAEDRSGDSWIRVPALFELAGTATAEGTLLRQSFLPLTYSCAMLINGKSYRNRSSARRAARFTCRIDSTKGPKRQAFQPLRRRRVAGIAVAEIQHRKTAGGKPCRSNRTARFAGSAS